MRKLETKKAYFYPIKDRDGSPLELMNVLTYVKNDEGKDVLDRVDTFIGRSDRDEFTKVAHTEELSRPGTIFRYASYVQEQEAFLSIYLDCYHTNLKEKVYTDKGAYYEDDDEEDWDEDDGEESLELMARLFSEHIQNADVDDQFVAELGEAADQFLTEKGFDLNSLAGLKAAQAWLENAKVEDAFYSEGPIENAIDWHVGEARIAAMLKVVKARIEKRMKK